MKKTILFFAIIFCSFIFGQVQVGVKHEDNKIYEAVDKEAEFPGGLNAFRQKFADAFNTKKINSNRRNSVYKTVITFVVERDGSISDIKSEGNNAKFVEESITAIKKIKDKWSPAMIYSQPVRQRFKLPITMKFD